MHIKIIGLHAPHAPRLQALLGDAHDVAGLPACPPEGLIEADVIITNALNAEQAARVRCRLVHVPGAGTEQIAHGALPSDSLVANVHGHEVPIAEFVMHAVLEHVLQLWRYPDTLDAHSWPRVYAARPLHNEAAGRTLTLVGYGHIGREVAHRARAHDLHVIGVNRRGNLSAADGVDESVPVARLAEILPRSDLLVLCCPLDESTRGLIDARALALLPEGALLVNVARAEVADEHALFASLRDGHLARAALDVWYRYPKTGETESAPSNLPFHTLPNVRATPHISALTPRLLERRYAFMAGNIERLARGETPRNLIAPPS